ncbi:DUF7261 family protein [Haloplanus halophilus]|uniref:DUF7261 family protein n=1 Tax=Haloplanus halophilus TaxID=2949993 RepID=UPI002041C871|nr:hypothetical protein [Haloplanus sp. GDY1]
MTRRRGQLVLLAATVVVTALVPMLLAYAQLGYAGDVAATADERTTLTESKRVLERSVAETTGAVSNGTAADEHRLAVEVATDRLDPAVAAVESAGTERGVAVEVTRNASAARRWAAEHCPRGPHRAFGACLTTDGVVTQTRANTTALVAVAVDVRVGGPDGAARATFVVRGVRGAVADRRPAPASPSDR